MAWTPLDRCLRAFNMGNMLDSNLPMCRRNVKRPHAVAVVWRDLAIILKALPVKVCFICSCFFHSLDVLLLQLVGFVFKRHQPAVGSGAPVRSHAAEGCSGPQWDSPARLASQAIQVYMARVSQEGQVGLRAY